MGHKKLINLGIALLVLQIMGIGIWFYVKQPAMDTSMNLFKIVPMLFGANLAIGLVLYAFKKNLSKLILANSIICPLIFFAAWIMWFTYYAK